MDRLITAYSLTVQPLMQLTPEPEEKPQVRVKLLNVLSAYAIPVYQYVQIRRLSLHTWSLLHKQVLRKKTRYFCASMVTKRPVHRLLKKAMLIYLTAQRQRRIPIGVYTLTLNMSNMALTAHLNVYLRVVCGKMAANTKLMSPILCKNWLSKILGS